MQQVAEQKAAKEALKKLVRERLASVGAKVKGALVSDVQRAPARTWLAVWRISNRLFSER